MNGAPGRASWVRARPASASAFCSARAPARVTGAMAPASVNGVTQVIWPWRAISIMPIAIGPSSFSGELVLIIVNTEGSAEEPLGVDAAGDPRHLDAIEQPGAAGRGGEQHLVGEQNLVQADAEMPHRGMNVERIGRPAAGGVDAVEVLRQADEVGIVREGAGAPAMIGVRAVGRPADRRKGDPVAADADRTARDCGHER